MTLTPAGPPLMLVISVVQQAIRLNCRCTRNESMRDRDTKRKQTDTHTHTQQAKHKPMIDG